MADWSSLRVSGIAKEAYLWSSLPRKIFKSSDVDIARIIGHPASLKDDWDEKRLDRLADRVFDLLRGQIDAQEHD